MSRVQGQNTTKSTQARTSRKRKLTAVFTMEYRLHRKAGRRGLASRQSADVEAGSFKAGTHQGPVLQAKCYKEPLVDVHPVSEESQMRS